MGLKNANFSCLLVAILIQGIIVVHCENATEPTSNPGGEQSVQPFLETTTKVSTEEKPTTTVKEETVTTTTAKATSTAEEETATKPAAGKTTTTAAAKATTKATSTTEETVTTAAEKTTTKVSTEEKPTTTLAEETTTTATAKQTASKTKATSTTEEKTATTTAAEKTTAKATTRAAKTSSSTTTTAGGKLPTATAVEVTIASTASTAREKPTAAKATAQEKTTTTIPVRYHEMTVRPSAAYKTSSDTGYTLAPEPMPHEKISISKPVMTSLPVDTSSPVIELLTSSPTKKVVDVEQVITPEVKTAQMSTTTPIVNSHALVTSPPLSKPKMQAYTSEDVQQAVTPEVQFTSSSSPTKPIVMSHPVVASSSVKGLLTSSKSKMVIEVISEDVEQMLTPQVEAAPLSSTPKPIVVSPQAIISSSIEEERSSDVLKIESTPILEKRKTASQEVEIPQQSMSSSAKQILSSSSKEQMTSSQASELETSSPIVGKTISQAKEGMTSSQYLEIMTLHTVVTSSESKQEITPSTALKIVSSSQVEEKAAAERKSPQLTKTLASVLMRSSSILIDAVASSKDENVLLLSQTEDVSTSLTVAKATKIMTAFHSVVTQTSSEALTSTLVEYSSQDIEGMMTSPPAKAFVSPSVMSSSQRKPAVTSSHSEKEMASSQLFTLDDSTSSGAMNIITSYVITPTKLLEHMTSSQALKSSPVVTSFSSPLINTKSSQEMMVVKSTLILSSSQLADMITSSRPVVTSSSDVVPPTEEVKESTTEMKATTTEKAQAKPTSQMSNTNVTVKVKVVNSTSAPETEHPTHPTHPTHHEDTHTTHTHPDETHTTHTPHDVHVTHRTMGYPHEPDVDASTNHKGRVDANWEVSIFVVVALIAGQVAFATFMVIKDRARTRGRTRLRERKRPVIGDDNGFVPLQELKVEKGEEPKVTRAEKRLSQRNSYHGNPEDSIPLLELHIMDGAPPVLNAHDMAQDTQTEEPDNSEKDSKPLLEGNGQMSAGKSKEIVSEDA